MTASTVSVVCGIPPEVLEALVKSRTQSLDELANAHKDTIALLKQNLDLNQRQIQAAFNILGEADIPPERPAAKLIEFAERFKALLATASAQPGDDPTIAALKADAQKAIVEGELAKADAVLADVEMEQRRALDRLVRVVANFGIAENEILACIRLNGSDGSVNSEWQTSASYILVEVGQND